jgi:diguanylate cyclase (GGDEF)-like protein
MTTGVMTTRRRPVRPTSPTPSLTSVATTPVHRRVALAVAIALTLAAGLTMPVAQLPGPVSTTFLPTWASLAVAADALTAYLFVGQFLCTRQPALAALAGTYLYSSLIIVPYLLTFSHVFAAEGLLHAGAQTAIWLWVCWHGGFPLGVLMYLWVDRRYGAVRLSARDARRLTALLGVIIPGVILVLSWGAIVGQGWLPVLIQGGHYTALFSLASGVGLVTWGLSAAAGVGLLLLTRGRTMAHLWLSLAMLASVLDVVLTISAGSRYSIGWYMARVTSLLEAGIVLCALLYEITYLYVRLAEQEHVAQSMNHKLRDANEALDKLAREDVLTGVPNRRTILELAATELTRDRRYGGVFTVLMIDIDNFKAFNDRYGHVEGDRVLRAVAGAMSRSIRATDQIGRYGGEEFLIVLTQTAAAGALAAAEHIRDAVRQERLDIEGHAVPLTVSIGVATVRPADCVVEDAVRRADAALYDAKRAGKDRVAQATDDAPVGVSLGQGIKGHVNEALRHS